jgi:hypothetical protein
MCETRVHACSLRAVGHCVHFLCVIAEYSSASLSSSSIVLLVYLFAFFYRAQNDRKEEGRLQTKLLEINLTIGSPEVLS